MPRLNGLMALIAVMCIAGVVSGELLGPMSRLRTWSGPTHGVDQAQVIRASLAGDAFTFSPPNPAVVAPPSPTPPPPPRYVGNIAPPVGDAWVWPVTHDAAPPDTPPYQFTSDAVAGGVTDADFSSSTWTPEPPPQIESPWVAQVGALPAAAVPEPAAWLMLVLGVGAVGVALRCQRSEAAMRLRTQPEILR